jgi:hypothetical protein
MVEKEHDFPYIIEVNNDIKLDIFPKGNNTLKTGFKKMEYALSFSK